MLDTAKLIAQLIQNRKQTDLYPISSLVKLASANMLVFHQHVDTLNCVHDVLVKLLIARPADVAEYCGKIAKSAEKLWYAVAEVTPAALTLQTKRLTIIKEGLDKLKPEPDLVENASLGYGSCAIL